MANDERALAKPSGRELDIHIDFSPLEPLREFFDEEAFERMRQWYEAQFRRRYYQRSNSPDILARRLWVELRFGMAVNAKSKIVDIGESIRGKIHEIRMRSIDGDIERIIKEAERAARYIDQEPKKIQDIENWLEKYDRWVESRLVPAVSEVSHRVGYVGAKAVEVSWKVSEFVGDKLGTVLGYGIVYLGYGAYRTVVIVSRETARALKAAAERRARR